MQFHKKAAAYGFYSYLFLMALWILGFVLPAIWVSQGNSQLAAPFYFAYSFTCHQLDNRSLCYYPNAEQGVASCAPTDMDDFAHRDIIISNPVLGDGFKLAVCARDFGIYTSMLLGAIAWAIFNRKNLATSKWPHPIWLILAIIPIALDGGTQLLEWRQSTNELRILTGVIVGFVVAFYLVPVFNQIFNPIISDVTEHFRKK